MARKKIDPDEFMTLTMNLHLEGVLVAQERATMKVDQLSQELPDEVLAGLVKQAALKLIPTLGVRDLKAIRAEIAKQAAILKAKREAETNDGG